MKKTIGLSGNTLKLLACISMLIDHAGMLLFPGEEWMRCVGRIAFPLFAFFIAEGCQYTRNRLKRLLTVFALGVVCEAVYILADGQYYGNVLLTFSLSIVLIYLWQECRRYLFRQPLIALLWGALFLTTVAAILWFVNRYGVDYGIAGVMMPVLISLSHNRYSTIPSASKRWCGKPTKLLLFVVALLWLVWSNSLPARQAWCLLSLPILLLYNGKPGNRRFKYGFYLFYPLHLALLQLIAWIR